MLAGSDKINPRGPARIDLEGGNNFYFFRSVSSRGRAEGIE
jgi:hypothetical protein